MDSGKYSVKINLNKLTHNSNVSNSNTTLNILISGSTVYSTEIRYNADKNIVIPKVLSTTINDYPFEKNKNYTISVSFSSIGFSCGSIDVTINYDSSSTVSLGASKVYAGQTVINVLNPSNGHDVIIGANGVAYLGIANQTAGGWSTVSDRRDKTDFKDVTDSLKFINSLKPIRFLNNSRDKYNSKNGFDQESYDLATLKGKRRQVGFIAQDVYESMKNVYGDDNYANIVDYNNYHNEKGENEFDRYMMCYTSLIPFLTGAVQELSKEVDTLKEIISSQQEIINSLKEKN